MEKITGFDYIEKIKKECIRHNKELYEELKLFDSGFSYVSKYYHNEKPEKLKNPRILLQFERGGMENSYINIYLGDYNHKNKEPELIGFWYIKDYFKELKKIFNFMMVMQMSIHDIQEYLFYGIY